MGIVKISDEIHEELRRTSQAMTRSINSQAEFLLKVGLKAQRHPNMSFQDLIQQLLDEQLD